MIDQNKTGEIAAVKRKNFFVSIGMIAIRLLFICACYLLLSYYTPKADNLFYCVGFFSALSIIISLASKYVRDLRPIFQTMKRVKAEGDHPRLWRAVNKVASLSSSPCPRVYLYSGKEKQACVYSLGPFKLSFIFFCDKLVDSLNNEELEAVAAHELGHVITRDSFFTIWIVFADIFIMFLSLVVVFMAAVEILSFVFIGANARSGNDLLLIFLTFGVTMPCFLRVLKYSLILYGNSHQISADKLSAIIMGAASPLLSALQKLRENDRTDYFLDIRCQLLERYDSEKK